jgi:hypothetical protein
MDMLVQLVELLKLQSPTADSDSDQTLCAQQLKEQKEEADAIFATRPLNPVKIYQQIDTIMNRHMERLIQINQTNFQRLVRHNSVPVPAKTRRVTAALYQPPAFRKYYQGQQQEDEQQAMPRNKRLNNRTIRPQCNPRMGYGSRINPYCVDRPFRNQQKEAKVETASNANPIHKYEVAINLRTTDEAND